MMDQLRILIADDSPDMALVMERVLARYGRVDIATNGVEVLEYPDLDSLDVIIMDIEMPKMDGLEATRRLRERGISTPIFACTSLASIRDKQLSAAAGCTAHFVKPVDFSMLLPALNRLTVHHVRM